MGYCSNGILEKFHEDLTISPPGLGVCWQTGLLNKKKILINNNTADEITKSNKIFK